MSERVSTQFTSERGAKPAGRWRGHLRSRTLIRVVCGLVAAVLLAAGAGVLWLYLIERAALPQMDGTLRVAGLAGTVIVRRDAHGVPHIEAASQDDLFFAQGYVTAQERLWQMDMFRRHANGELAEVLGPSLVEHDRRQRVLLIRKTAERIYRDLPADDRKRFDEYARGVNSFIAQAETAGALPPEFKLLRYQPRPWAGTDSVSVGLMEVVELDMHAATKLDRWYVRAKLNNDDLEKDLYPVGSWRDHPPTGTEPDWNTPRPAAKPSKNDDDDDDDDDDNTTAQGGSVGRSNVVVSPVPKSEGPGASMLGGGLSASSAPDDTQRNPNRINGTTKCHLSTQLAAASQAAQDDIVAHGDEAGWEALGRTACAGCAVGSNEWVVAGKHTASGKPLLSNDMHISITEPNVWYMAALKASGFDAAGVTLPGMPLVVAGHNEHVAWGFTALYADVQDLYFEKLDGKGNYEGNDTGWHPLDVDHETIRVRFGKDVTLDVQSTDHGPLVNSIVGENRPVALKWNLYDPALHSIPLYAMNVASNWTEFSRALEDWDWPAQNLVYSDDQGHIAYHAIGKVPIRESGAGLFDLPLSHDTKGTRSEWGSSECARLCLIYIPFDQMPNSFDPPSGFLATANARVTTDQSLYPLTDEWIEPYRVERIYKSLSGRDGLKPADMLAVQTDIYSEVDQELGQRFAYAIDHTDGPQGNGDERLRKAADLMRSWDGKLTVDSAAASIVDQTREALWPLILKPKLGGQWKQYHWAESDFALEEMVMHAKAAWLPPGYKDWNALLTEAVREGMQNGKAPTDLDNWKYGDWHVVDIEHPLAGFLPLIGRVAGTGAQPQSGDTTTVKQVSPFIGPSQRFTMDWSNVDGSTENIVLGESSDPLSPYYRDQWKAWYDGTTFALPFSPAAMEMQTTHVLRLLP